MKPINIILFWDHAKNTRSPLLCCVCGFFLKEDEKAVCLTWWYTHGLESKEEIEDNQEPFVILKSAIIRRIKVPLPKILFKIISGMDLK